MASPLPFDVNARVALLAGAGSLAVASLIWLEILRLRRRQARMARTAKGVTDTWHPILSLASFGVLPDVLPALKRDDHIPFLKLWVYLQTSLRGEAREALTAIARALHCDRMALQMLARGKRGDRLLAIVTSGHLKLDAALPLLHLIADSGDSVMSLQAQHAILRIAPEAANLSVPRCVRREDWPVSQLLSSLRESGPVLLPAFLAEIDNAGNVHVSRALQLASGLRLALDAATQQRLLQLPRADSLAAALPLVDQSALLPQVRVLSRHPESSVRAAATRALARIGEPADLARLQALITDPSWVVRNQAAKAIVALPGAGQDALRAVEAATPDRYARNMAQHVLAELAMGSGANANDAIAHPERRA